MKCELDLFTQKIRPYAQDWATSNEEAAYWANVATPLKRLSNGCTGFEAGAVGGGITGACVGGGIATFGGPVTTGAGALAGGVAGGLWGGVSGLINGISVDPDISTENLLLSSGCKGVLSGALPGLGSTLGPGGFAFNFSRSLAMANGVIASQRVFIGKEVILNGIDAANALIVASTNSKPLVDRFIKNFTVIIGQKHAIDGQQIFDLFPKCPAKFVL
jgi:hypothetical protein